MVFFFFKQKTAYEMRISDWSSDVCSSDLLAAMAEARLGGTVDLSAVRLLCPIDHEDAAHLLVAGTGLTHLGSAEGRDKMHKAAASGDLTRSEERRDGKECVSTCRSRWSPYH